MTTEQALAEARVRTLAKAFANRLRLEGLAEFIPTEDVQELTGDSYKTYLYHSTLRSKSCVRQKDLRWKFQR